MSREGGFAMLQSQSGRHVYVDLTVYTYRYTRVR